MSEYLRYCSVTAGGGAGSVTYNADGLRIRFEMHSRSTQSPGIAKITISNLLPSIARQFIHKEYTTISVDAGYQSGHGIIFSGNVVWATYGRESPTDTLTTIYAADTDHGHNYGVVNTTLPPGSTPQQHLNVALQAMAPYGVTQGYIGVDLSTPVYPRSVTLWGMARDVLSNIAKFKNAVVSYQQGAVTMVPQNGSAPGGPIILNTTTGLIGMATQSIEGVLARCLINPSIAIHKQVQINQALVNQSAPQIILTGAPNPLTPVAPIATDGLYIVYNIDTFGDTRGNPWYQDLAMYATNIPRTPAEGQASLPFEGAN